MWRVLTAMGESGDDDDELLLRCCGGKQTNGPRSPANSNPNPCPPVRGQMALLRCGAAPNRRNRAATRCMLLYNDDNKDDDKTTTTTQHNDHGLVVETIILYKHRRSLAPLSCGHHVLLVAAFERAVVLLVLVLVAVVVLVARVLVSFVLLFRRQQHGLHVAEHDVGNLRERGGC